jgi:amidase
MSKMIVVMFAACLTTVACSATPNSMQKVLSPLVVGDFQANGMLEKSLPEIVEALNNEEISSEELVQLYLARIEAIDKNGPKLQAVLHLNSKALEIAKERDQQRASENIKGALHGVPVMLKDNIESKDNMPTTAGSLALKNNFTKRDSPLFAGLIGQGAIFLGKTNLSQWANFRSEGSISGWSALGGQVRNPHILDRSPCGSSSGSGVATAASLAAATVGTETNGSIICPSNVNGIVGFKPTLGIVPQQYIIPISASQDTAGPMTKTVKGAALMMNALASTELNIDFTKGLSKDALKGVRVGVLNFASGQSATILSNFDRALKDLISAGAILVDIDTRPPTPKNYGKISYDNLKYEFKDGLNTYLASTDSEQVPTRTLQELIEFNLAHKDIELALFDQSIFVASESMGTLDTPAYKDGRNTIDKTTREEGIDKLMTDYNVSVLVSPSGVLATVVDPINGDVWPSNWPGYGSHAARAGYPHATVPMGGVNAIPIGISFIGGKNTDAQVLSYAYAYEQYSMRRLKPQYLKTAEEIPTIANAMKALSSE